jgi:hypothetical protein
VSLGEVEPCRPWLLRASANTTGCWLVSIKTRTKFSKSLKRNLEGE